MGKAVSGAAVQVMVQNLLSTSFEEIKLVWDFEEDLKTLKDSLTKIQKFLSDAEEKEINYKGIKEWLEKLEDVAFEADAVLDELNYHLLQQKVKNQSRETEKVTCSSSSDSTNLLCGTNMAHKIKDVNEKLEIIDKEAVSKGLRMAIANAGHASMVGLVQSYSFSIEPNFVGRQSDVANIVDMLVSAPFDDKFSVIPIVGMSGLGKSTLARKIFNHERIAAHFGEKIWVHVSVNFDAVTLFKVILENLTKKTVGQNLTKKLVLERIRAHVDGKSYLLVLDDVWNEDFGKWEDFMSGLSEISFARNGIVITTRKESIASVVGSRPSYRLSNLSEDECWSIIQAKALVMKVNVEAEFEKIGKHIAQGCGGLPLSATVIGGLLCGKSKEEWSSILKHLFSNFGQQDENPVMKILRLSYNHLPSSSLKRCFAYCAVFPKDFQIEKETLIKLWMAEGFLQANEENDLETVGSSFFNHLLQTFLIQESKRDNLGNITHCTMHDLVHDLARSVSGSRSVSVMDSRNDLNKVRYLYLKSNELYCISREQARYLRTFIFNGKVANNIFSGFNCLHVLILTGLTIKELPIEIEKQIHLRFLDISSTRIKYLPDSVSKLSNLQTLVVPNLKKLPNTMVDLLNLRHLDISFIELPPWIGKLTSLQTLSYYLVGHDEGCGVGELGNLKNLKGNLHIEYLERTNDNVEAKQADLYGKPNILGLILSWGLEPREDDADDENVLEGLQPHPNLKSLDIRGYKSRNFPSWTMNMAVRNDIDGRCVGLSNLINIRLYRCSQCEEIPNLGHLPYLKSLEIHGLHNVRSIGLAFYGLEETTIAFPALERLVLDGMIKLTEWVEVEGAITAFPCLEALEIHSCYKLKSIPSYFPWLKNLYIREVDVDFSLTNVCSSTSSLQKLAITSFPGLISLPDELFLNNQNLSCLKICSCPELLHVAARFLGGGASLRELSIFNCKNLRELGHDLNTLHSLEELRIDCCPGLKSLPCVKGQSSGLISLRHLEIRYCENLRELSDDLSTLHSLEILDINDCPKLKSIPCVRGQSPGLASLRELEIFDCGGLTEFSVELLESCTSSLKSFSLYGLENLENLDMVTRSLSTISSLENLYLYNLPKLMNFPMVISCLGSLRKLELGRFSESLDLVSFNSYINGIFKEHQSLRELRLYGQEHWESLPDQIQHLTSLELLALWDFGIEELPEWLGKLSCLQTLSVQNCRRLRHIPCKEDLQCLTNLSELRIDGGSVTKKRRS